MNSVFATTARVRSKAFMLGSSDGAQGALYTQDGAIFVRSKEYLRLHLYATLMAADLLCITFAFLVAGMIRLGSPMEEQSLRTLAIVIPTFIAVALNNSAYSLESLQRPAWSAGRGVGALFYGIAVAIALLFSFKMSTDFSRAIFATGTAIAIAAVFAGRLMLGKYLGPQYDWTFANHLLIVDAVDVQPSGKQRWCTRPSRARPAQRRSPLFHA